MTRLSRRIYEMKFLHGNKFAIQNGYHHNKTTEEPKVLLIKAALGSLTCDTMQNRVSMQH